MRSVNGLSLAEQVCLQLASEVTAAG